MLSVAVAVVMAVVVYATWGQGTYVHQYISFFFFFWEDENEISVS
jgi:hypothetical protein